MKGNTVSEYYSRVMHPSAESFDDTSISYWITVISALSVLLVLSFGGLASAQDVTGAANAFSRAQKAELAGDHAMAAEFYELADSLAPSPEALRSALRSRKSAGQLTTAARHAESLRHRYPYDDKSQELADATILEAKQVLMRFEIECKPIACTLMVDDAAATIEPDKHHVIYIESGTHEVVASFDGEQSNPSFVEAETGKRGSLVFVYAFDADQEREKASLPTSLDERKDGTEVDLQDTSEEGLSIWYFLSGVAITVGAGAATIWSGLDVLDLHETYKKNQTQDIYESGLDREQRTNILLGVTAVAGAATCVLALFTQWDGSQEADSKSDPPAKVNIGLNSGLFELRGTF